MIPGSGRSLGEGNGNLLQDSCLENPMDRGGSERAGYDRVTSTSTLHSLALSEVLCVELTCGGGVRTSSSSSGTLSPGVIAVSSVATGLDGFPMAPRPWLSGQSCVLDGH